MEPFVRNFIRASLIWLGIGVSMGLSMAWWPADHLVYRAAHAHANLLGFVSMMIFGVAYHVIPRFAGSPLHSRGLAHIHLWVANVGLVGLVGGWIARVWVGAPGNTLLHLGAALSGAGAFLFIYNIWRSLSPVRREVLVGAPGAGCAGGRTPATGRPLPQAVMTGAPGVGR